MSIPAHQQALPTLRIADHSDIPETATVLIKAWRDSIWHQCYFPDVTDEDYAQLQVKELKHWFNNPKATIYIVEDKSILGYAVLTKAETYSILTPPATPVKACPFPPGTSESIVLYRSKRDEWKADVLVHIGPHYRLDHIAVVPEARKLGIATQLLNKVCKRAFAEGLPLYFETVDDVLPFYDRFATPHCYEVVSHGEPLHLDSGRVQTNAHFLELKAAAAGRGQR